MCRMTNSREVMSCIQHLELRSGLEELIRLGDSFSCPDSYWQYLEKAAESMDMIDRAAEIRELARLSSSDSD